MLVFYDTETTGTSTAFDQLVQFAAVLTDDQLREVERFEIRCRLMPHVVPSPGALRVTGLTPADLTNPSLPSHTEALQRIYERLRSWSPATFLGWNSLRFDESLMRQALFQTLQPPFLTTSHGNTRGDVMRMVQAAHRRAPGVVVLPTDERGLPSFRLDRVAPANGCESGPAHDAMADVDATLGVARRIFDGAPELWHDLMSLTSPHGVRQALSRSEPLLLTEFIFNRPHSRLIAWCGTNPDYEGEQAAFDLAFRPEDFIDLPVQDLVAVLRRRPRPILSVRATRQPLLASAEAAPDDTAALRFPRETLMQRAQMINGAAEFHERVGQALRQRPRPRDPNATAEQSLYGARIGAADATRLDAFHAAPWEERLAIVDSMADDRLRHLGRRLVWLERPEVLAEADRARWARWTAERVLSQTPDVPWRTVTAALREVETAIADAAEPKRPFFEAIRDFLETTSNRWAEFA